MGSYVKGKIVYEKKMRTSGHGKIILKEENTPADRVNLQCDIEDAIQELNINITFYSDRCRGEDIIYLLWTRRPSRSYAKAGMNRPAGVKTAHFCGHTSS